MSVFCQNLWYNVYSDNFFRKCQFFVRIYGTMCIVIILEQGVLGLSLPPFLFMVIPPLRPISRIGLFFLYQPRELSWTVHQLSNTFQSIPVLSTQIGKWSLQNEIPVHLTLSAPSSRLFLACRIFSFWNFHFPIFSYDLWNCCESLQSSRKLFFLPYM